MEEQKDTDKKIEEEKDTDKIIEEKEIKMNAAGIEPGEYRIKHSKTGLYMERI